MLASTSEKKDIKDRQRWKNYFCLFVSFLILLYIGIHRNDFIDDSETLGKGMKWALLLIVWGVGTVAIFVRLNFSEKVNKILNIIYVICAPLFIFLNMEVAIFIKSKTFAHMNKHLLLFNVAVIGVMELVFIVITNRVRLGTDICAFICVGFNVINHFVYEFRGTPVMASDIATIGTAAEVADNYEIKFDFYTILALVVLFTFMMVGRVVKCEPVFKKKRYRLCGVIVMAVVSTVCVKQYVISDYLDDHGFYLSLFKPLDSYRKYGTMAGFSETIKYAVLKKPEGYSEDAVKKITSKYESDTVDKDKKRPNVIVVINEAFSDLQALGDLETNEDYMPFIHNLMKEGNCVSGKTYASIVGGQTANTEYEFLTGNSMAFLPTGSVAFQLYVKNAMPSLVTDLKSEGYIGNTAIHLQKAQNYRRDRAYPLLGFDNFYDYQTVEVPFEKMRKYGTDECTYKNIIHDYEKYREDSDEPYLGYTMTMQNHSPYYEAFDDFKQRITLENADAPDVAYYLSLIKYSDEAFEELLNYFENVDEPTVVFMTGDHQPRIWDDSLDEITNGTYKKWDSEEMMKRYEIPFVIWANYDIEKKTIEKTSMNYLQTTLLETIGSELTGFQKFQQDVEKEIPVLTSNGYWGADGNFYDVNDEDSPYYDLINEYATLQYNDLIDHKHRQDDFFNLKEN